MEREVEQSLIAKSAEGDPSAFRQLVESHQAFAYGLALRFVREPEAAEDIVQESFIKVWRNIGRYDSAYRFKTWLGKIVTNLCLDFVKRNRRANVILDGVLKVQETSYQLDDLEKSELKEIVTRLADQLTEKQKAVFILRDLELLSPEEVCDMLGMSSGNMKSNLYHARIKIKEGLEYYYLEKRLTNES